MAENTNYEFKGWVGEDPSAAKGNMQWKTFEPKPWEETDVDIKITHSGICGSDLHTISSGWGPANYPCVVGHEIVGVAVRVGSKAEGGIKVGDVVGVGAQNDSCLGRDGPCDACDNNNEQYCSGNVGTYNSKHFGCGPGKKVGVVGVGGLGHFAVLFAKALGADEVVGISRKGDKKDDALALGCDDYIATAEDEDWETKNKSRFDLIISTVSSPKVPFTGYIGMLKMDGTMVQVGAPEEALPLHAFSLIPQRKRLAGSMIGSPSDIRAMFQLAADKNVKPWVEQRPMSEANQAIVDFEAGKPRFRYVLVN